MKLYISKRSARTGPGEKFKNAAEKCGQLVGENGYDLVYGASSDGLMGIVARAADANGAKVFGVFPTPFLPDNSTPVNQHRKFEVFNKEIDEVTLVNNMYDREYKLYDLSDIFLVLPGEMGTIDEVSAVISMKHLGWHKKEIIFINTQDYWNKFIDVIEHAISMEFISNHCREAYKVFQTPEEAFEYLKTKRDRDV